MEKITYTSPRTGLVYTAVPQVSHRVVAYTDGEPVWADESTWNIALDGKWVQFALSEAGIAGAVARAEGVHDGWSASPRD